MAEVKTPLAEVPPVSTLDTILGVRDDGTGPQIVRVGVEEMKAQLTGPTFIPFGPQYLGTWDADANSPTLASGVGDEAGDYYIVDVAGSTTIDGVSDWRIGDRIIWNADPGIWQQVRPAEAGTEQVMKSLAFFAGSGPQVPVVATDSGQIIIGLDRATGALIGDGVGETPVNRVLGAGSFQRYIGTGPVYPIVTDAAGRVLLGVNQETGAAAGLFAGGSGSSSSGDPTAIPAPISAVVKNHLLFYGQSLSVGAAAGSVLSTTQPYSNVTFSGGPRAWDGSDWDFATLKPLVEDDTAPAPDGYSNRAETMCSGAANYASTCLALAGIAPADHVILASTAGHGGYLLTELNKGSAWYDHFKAHVTGAHLIDASHAVQVVPYIQGEADAATENQTAYATYRAGLAQLRSDADGDIKAITGQSSPVYFLLYQTSYGARTWKDIALAQLDLAQTSDYFYMTAPTYAFPHADDHIHLTAIGYKWLGAYFGRAYAAIVQGRKPVWLDPVSATVRGAVVRVRFDVPTLPLVLDTTDLANTTDKGFKVLDGASAATISNISVSGSDVLITISSAPSGVVTVRYALDALGSGITIVGGASGNLRDSTPDIITISGTDYPLYYVCPAFELTATKLGE